MYYFQMHEEGQSPNLYKFDEEWVWLHSQYNYKINLGKQIETLRINKSDHTCDEGNSNRFMQCMESHFLKELDCILPWFDKNQDNHGFNECTGKDKFKKFREITTDILTLKPRGVKEFFNEDCYLPRLYIMHYLILGVLRTRVNSYQLINLFSSR